MMGVAFAFAAACAFGKNVENLELRHVSSDEIFVSWDSDSDDEIPVLLNGKKCESVEENAGKSNSLVSSLREEFYGYYDGKFEEAIGRKMVRTRRNFYKFSGLESSTEYKVNVGGSEISVKTQSAGKVLDVTSFGAVPGELDSVKAIEKNTKAIQKAIKKCPKNGTVLIPDGVFMCGSIKLKSDMTLKIDGVLKSSPFAENYDFGFLMYKYYTDRRYFGLINADGARNVRIVGKGTVDGNGWKYASSNGKPTEGNAFSSYKKENDSGSFVFPLFASASRKNMHERGILASSCAEKYLEGIGKTRESASEDELKFAFSSRSTMVIIRNSSGVFIEGLSFVNPANHTINTLDSENIGVTGIKVHSFNCANGDGVGLICSQNAWIWNNFFDTGDDSVVFSAGVGKAASTTGEKGVSNVRIFGNHFRNGHGGVAFGSHTALGISGVSIHDNIFNWSNIPFRVKSNPANGGEVCDVKCFRNAMGDVYQTFLLSTDYKDGSTASTYGKADTPAVFHDVEISDCDIYRARQNTYLLYAEEGYPHHHIKFSGVTFVVFHDDEMGEVTNASECDFSGVKTFVVE